MVQKSMKLNTGNDTKKINETRSWFFETINRIGKLLSRLTMRKGREGKMGIHGHKTHKCLD